MMTFTVLGPGDTTEHATMEAALRAAANEIEGCVDDDGSWYPEVKDIRITVDGRTTHRAVEKITRLSDYEDVGVDEDGDDAEEYFSDYEMQQVAPMPGVTRV